METEINEYRIYGQLKELERIAASYTKGRERAAMIGEYAERFASRKYCAAVVGEFKRGKSSFINAMLGTEILPADVEPTTAVVTRVVYGEKKRIVICFKDGSRTKATVEEIADFTTKLDDRRRKKAESISEVLVHYPSVFCRDHIEVIDTPGMNDEDRMSRITFGLLGEVDTAIMVVSAAMPMSATEQSFILDLIAAQGIHHIFFVVSCIDMISNDPVKQDKQIDVIRNRIQKDLYERAASRFADDHVLSDKANRILSAPDIYGVSSVQAIEGFIKDDEELVEKSRLPLLKKELLTFLTAAQRSDVLLNARDHFRYIDNNIESWYKKDVQVYRQNDELGEILRKYRGFYSNADSEFAALMNELDNELEKDRYYGGLVKSSGTMASKAIDLFSEAMSFSGRYKGTRSYSDIARSSLTSAAKRAKDQVRTMCNVYWKSIIELLGRKYSEFVLMMPYYNGSDTEKSRRKTLEGEWEKYICGCPYPRYDWTLPPVPQIKDLSGIDLDKHLRSLSVISVKKYIEESGMYIKKCMDFIRTKHKERLADKSAMTEFEHKLDSISGDMNLHKLRHEENKAQLDKMRQQLGENAAVDPAPVSESVSAKKQKRQPQSSPGAYSSFGAMSIDVIVCAENIDRLCTELNSRENTNKTSDILRGLRNGISGSNAEARLTDSAEKLKTICSDERKHADILIDSVKDGSKMFEMAKKAEIDELERYRSRSSYDAGAENDLRELRVELELNSRKTDETVRRFEKIRGAFDDCESTLNNVLRSLSRA